MKVVNAAIVLLVALFATPLHAETVAIVNATIYTMDGVVGDGPLENATIVFTGDAIDAVGVGIDVPSGARVLDAKGGIVTPGLIDAATGLGTVEIWAVSATRDSSSVGVIRAAFRSRDGYNPESTAIDVTRIEGITSAVTMPSGALVAGQAFHCELDGAKVAEVCSDSASYMTVSLGEHGAAASGGSRAEAILRLREALDDAKLYGTSTNAFDSNQLRELGVSRLDLEALQPVLAGSTPTMFSVDRASDIDVALEVAAEYGLTPMLMGAAEAWKRPELMAGLIVVIDPMQNAPESFESGGARADQAALLSEAGAKVVIASFDTHNARTLRQSAGNAVRAGMHWEAALAAVTRHAAEAAGQEKSLGRLAPGYRANVVLWTGDPFELETRASSVFIGGREVELESRQTKLFERYR